MRSHELKILAKKLPTYFLSSLLIIFIAGCACTDPLKPEKNRKEVGDDKGSNQIAELEVIKVANKLDSEIMQAQAIISSSDNQISGSVKFTKTEEGIKIIADIEGLTPGEHGFHIHEFGDCSGKNLESVGSHYDPTHQKHGKPGEEESHTGDLGNLNADENGHAHYEAVNKIIKLQGRNSILGRSVIIHADADDYKSQPAGASGAKIACGVIQPMSS